MEDFEKDLQGDEGLKWRRKAVDREVWPSVIREAKALRRPWGQIGSK